TEREESLVPQARDDPALRDLHADIDLCFVARFSGPSRNYRRAVVIGELFVGPLHAGLVPARPSHAALELIWDQCARDAAEVFEAAHVTRDEIRSALRGACFCEGEVRSAEHHHEQLDVVKLAGLWIRDLWLLSRIIHEALFAGDVDLPHRQPALLQPGSV